MAASIAQPPPSTSPTALTTADAPTTPCTTCGACCVGLRVSFYWGEGEDADGGWVPVAFTQPLAPHRRMMRGTDAAQPRCIALVGTPGRQVSCAIYAQRPSPCREFNWHGEEGAPNARCNERRRAVGLPPLPDPLPVDRRQNSSESRTPASSPDSALPCRA